MERGKDNTKEDSYSMIKSLKGNERQGVKNVNRTVCIFCFFLKHKTTIQKHF